MVGLVAYLSDYFNWTYFTIYFIIHAVTYYMATSIGSKYIMKADVEISKKFSPFERTDHH